MSLNIPEFMPILSRGGHTSPAEGACIMEYASFLNGEAWTDAPSCTDHLLADAARYINDELDDEDRQRLLPLLPRLMGTAASSDRATQAILDAAAKFVEHLSGHEEHFVSSCAEAAQDRAAHGSTAAVSEAHIATSGAGMDLVEFLSTLIDAYDKATGRTAPATVTEDDLRRCAELTGAKA